MAEVIARFQGEFAAGALGLLLLLGGEPGLAIRLALIGDALALRLLGGAGILLGLQRGGLVGLGLC